jgi:hypothetical protein
VSGASEFRTPEQGVLRLLEECAELRATLKTISAQIGRMEKRVKTAHIAYSGRRSGSPDHTPRPGDCESFGCPPVTLVKRAE